MQLKLNTLNVCNWIIKLKWKGIYDIKDAKNAVKAVLCTCATFSANKPLARIKKGGARRGGAREKNMAQWQWRDYKMALIRAISAPF